MKKKKIKISKKTVKKILLALVCIVLVAAVAVSSTLYFGGKFDESRGFDMKNNAYAFNGDEVNRLIAVKPNKNQLAFSDMEYYSFIHYGMNTFTGNEWGDGTDDPSVFNPETIDTDQWARVLKENGSKGIIFTAKHHDGFCLWQTAYTDYSIKNSPYMDGKGDIVKQVAESCKKYGLKFGIYLSPWDRNSKDYGTDAYNDYYINQLTELCTNYGDIFCFWLDGAKGDDVEDFNYDFNRYFEVIHKLQPNAVISVCGEDVRWIGNETGTTRQSEWSVVSKGNESLDGTEIEAIDSTAEDLGSREALKNYKNLVWYPAEADVSIYEDAWFYNGKSKLRKAKDLADIYFNTVGGNASLLLNVPPSKNGIIESDEEETLKKFKQEVDKRFENEIDYKVYNRNNQELLDNIKNADEGVQLTQFESTLTFKFDSKEKVKTVVLQEDISQSQRIEAFEIWAKVPGGYKKVYSGTTVGSKKIVRLSGKDVRKTDEIKIIFTQSRSYPFIKNIQFFS